MITRQMLSAVSSGRMPRCRSTSLRIMSASRAGRNADPDSWVRLARISRSMISPRSMRSACIAASIRSISRLSSASEGPWAMRVQRRPAIGKSAARAPPLIGAKPGEIKENVDLAAPLPYVRRAAPVSTWWLDRVLPEPWFLSFPVITIRDMVRAQAMLLDHLGVPSLFAIAGGSMGGMQVLQWAASYPERVFAALPIAASTRHSAQNIAFHEVGRQAVMADPDWRAGRYFAEGTNPRRGLAVARMAAHITYLSDAALHRKFGRRFQDRDNPTFSFDADFQVESYLRHQGITFVERFDANSYLYLTRAMDYFDVAADHDGVLANAFKGTPTRFCVISFTSDWLFPTSDSRAIVHALNAGGARVSFAEIVTDKGHDAFLLEEPELFAIVRGFLDSAGEARGLKGRR